MKRRYSPWLHQNKQAKPASLFGKLKATGIDLDLPDHDGVTPLGLAAMAGPRSMGAFRHLIQAGANAQRAVDHLIEPDRRAPPALAAGDPLG